VAKPLTTIGMGVDTLPENIRNSKILTGNNLGQLGNTEQLPATEEIKAYKTTLLSQLFNDWAKDEDRLQQQLHHLAKRLLDEGKVNEAWKVLLSTEIKTENHV
jgi:hypothetical protein